MKVMEHDPLSLLNMVLLEETEGIVMYTFFLSVHPLKSLSDRSTYIISKARS